MMTFINKNKFFKYTVILDTSQDLFKACLVDNISVYGIGNTIEEAVKKLEETV